MRRILLFLNILLFPFALYAQNWSPVNLSDKYNYTIDNNPAVTNTIWVDSTMIISGDSVFYLNRIMCDPCAIFVGGPNACDTCYWLKNQPQFMMRSITRMPGALYSFTDTSSFVIDADAGIGSSWMFDTVNNITALVTSVAPSVVFGNPDSVKFIVLSSTDTIKLSKTHGILQFPNGYGQNSKYMLTGIEGRNLGMLVPGMKAIFDFNVGDRFEYYVSGASASCFCYGWSNRKYEITSKQVNSDTITYGIYGFEKIFSYPIGPPAPGTVSATILNTTITFIDSTDHAGNMFSHQMLNISKYRVKDFMGTGTQYSSWQPDFYDRITTYIDTNGILTKSFGYDPAIPPHSMGAIILNPASDTMVPQAAMQDMGESYMSEMKAGLGQTKMIWSQNFEWGMQEKLIAYFKGQDTVGVFTPDSFFVMNLDEQQESDVQIFPNPSMDRIYIMMNEWKAMTEIMVLNLQGQIIKTYSASAGKSELNISELPAGIYVVRINTEKGTISRRISVIK